MKVLITGGAGFIGTNLVLRYLKDETCDIYIVDNLSTGQYENIKKIINSCSKDI